MFFPRGLLSDASPESASNVKRLIYARLLMVVLAAAALIVLRGTMSLSHPWPIYLLLILVGVADLLYLSILPWVRATVPFMLLQFLLDVVAVGCLVFLTGGVTSNYVNLFFVLILGPSLMLSRKVSGIFASLATVGLAIVTALYQANIGLHYVPVYYLPEPLTTDEVVTRLLLTTIAFYGVAYFSGLLSERLELARSLNEEVLQNMSEGVAVFDNECRIVFLNSEFNALFAGVGPLQLGDHAEDAFHHDNEEALCRLLRSHTPARFELPFRDGGPDFPSRPPVEIRISPLGHPQRPKGSVMLAIDLRLRQRAELAECRAERFSAVCEMAAGLAHEVRNPLASVRGSIQEISRDFPANSPNRRLAEIVMRESDRLDRIITSFLQFARQRPLRPQDVDLSQLLDEVKLLLEKRGDAGRSQIRLETEALPLVRCDTDQIREVFLNLGLNALSAMGGEGTLTIRAPATVRPSGTVLLRRMGRREGIAISVSDTGPGLPAGLEERVFEPFFTTKERGSGLGLAIVRRVVESHDGVVWAQSRPNEGAEFCVWLPLDGPFEPGAPRLNHLVACQAEVNHA